MLLNQSQNSGFSSVIALYLMYGGLSLFFIWKIFKTYQAQKHLEGKIFKFKKNISKIMIGLGLLILIFSGLSIFQGQYITGILMALLIIVLIVEYTTPNYFAENGFLIDSKFIEWKQVKKWAFQVEKAELVVNYKKGFEEKTAYMKLKPEDVAEIDELFRTYKLKK